MINSKNGFSPDFALKLGLFFLFAGVLRLSLTPLAGYDIWWHLAMARKSLSGGGLLNKDVFSYTVYGTNWNYKDLGASYIEYFFWFTGKAAGIVVLKALVFSVVAGIYAYILIKLRKISYFNAMLVLTLIAAVSAFRFTERPQIFSFLSLALLLAVIEYHRIYKKLLWLTLVITVFNANLHRGALILPVFLFGYAFSVFIPDYKKKDWKIPLLTAFASVILIFFNPFGTNILSTSLKMMFSEHFRSMIPEWQKPTFTYIKAAVPSFFIFAAVTLISLPFLKKEKNPQLKIWNIFLLLAGFALAMRAIRFLPYFAFAAALPVASGLNEIKILSSTRIRLFSFVIPAIFLISAVNSPFNLKLGIEKRRYPEEGVNFVKKHALKGRMLNEFRYGGYLMFYLPRYKVYSDGRNDLIYPADLRKKSTLIFTKPSVFKAETEKYGVEWLFLNNAPDFTPSGFIDLSSEWTLVHISEKALIYVRTNGKNSKLAETSGYKLIKPHLLTQSLLNAFKTGKQKEYFNEIKRFLYEDPDSIIGHKLAAKFFMLNKDKKRYEFEIKILETLGAI